MFGKINLETFTGLTIMPQKAASAWSAVNDIVGATYKPLLFAGTQITRGTTYWFIAEQTFSVSKVERRIVTIAVNEFNGRYEVVNDSIEVVIG